MRRMMHSLFVLAVLSSSAWAQSELTLDPAPVAESESCNTCTSAQPSMSGCGNSVGSQLAAYMNSFPTHPNLWASYSSERNKRLDHLFRHVNGCNCEDPKRNLYSQPSTICSKGCGSCETKGSEQLGTPVISAIKEKDLSGFSQLHTQPSSSIQSAPAVLVFGKSRPTVPQVNEARLPASLTAKPANSSLSVKPLR